ncbi:MAG: hypothetical protein KF789_11095 [Bdellovibrionaceae bacterium]|nr:hypothetical protein [Pseudobdellovibrionaceae bacterium]
MQNSPQQDQTIEKLKQLLSNRFGKGLELRRLADVNHLTGDGGVIVRERDLYIPLKIENAYLGTAVIPKGADLSPESHLQIAQVVRMVLEPSLYKDYLERAEHNLRFTEKAPTPALHLLDEDSFEIEDEEPISPDLPKLVSNLVHLHGHDAHRIKKAALLLHEMTGRWAFAPLIDLGEQISSSEDLIKLGAMTLFIEDIETLDEKCQQIILEYVSSPRSSQDPLLVTGSLKGSHEISESSQILSDLKDELLVNTLELDRAPLTEKGLKEVLTLMFFEAKGEA